MPKIWIAKLEGRDVAFSATTRTYTHAQVRFDRHGLTVVQRFGRPDLVKQGAPGTFVVPVELGELSVTGKADVICRNIADCKRRAEYARSCAANYRDGIGWSAQRCSAEERAAIAKREEERAAGHEAQAAKLQAKLLKVIAPLQGVPGNPYAEGVPE